MSVTAEELEIDLRELNRLAESLGLGRRFEMIRAKTGVQARLLCYVDRTVHPTEIKIGYTRTSAATWIRAMAESFRLLLADRQASRDAVISSTGGLLPLEQWTDGALELEIKNTEAYIARYPKASGVRVRRMRVARLQEELERRSAKAAG